MLVAFLGFEISNIQRYNVGRGREGIVWHTWATVNSRARTTSFSISVTRLRWRGRLHLTMLMLQELDLAIAERKVAEALPLLKKTEKSLLPGAKSGLLAAYAVIPAQGESDQGAVCSVSNPLIHNVPPAPFPYMLMAYLLCCISPPASFRLCLAERRIKATEMHTPLITAP